MRFLHLSVTSILAASLLSCSSPPPENLGLQENGLLAGCPDSPNCVSSTAMTKSLHIIGPFNYATSKEEARQALIDIIDSLPEAQWVVTDDDYLRAEFTSRWFKFVDDVEFQLSIPTIIHVRSASRMGYSDLGVNRKRMEKLRSLFSEKK